MNIEQRLFAIHKKQSTYETEIMLDFRAIKPEFVQFITNNEIPLVNRWDTWLEVSYDLKEHVSHIPCPHSKIFNKFFLDEEQDWSFRGNVVDVREVLFETYEYGKFFIPINLKEKEFMELLEEILAMNLGSFEYD